MYRYSACAGFPVWVTVSPFRARRCCSLDLGRMDYYVKRKCCYRVVYEVVHKCRVVFNGECEGDVVFLVLQDSSIIAEAPVESHIVD